MARLIADKYKEWETLCRTRFERLKANEETLNKIVIGLYGLEEELTPTVNEKDVSIRKANIERDIKSLLSYAVGCLFGRYSHHIDGLFYAGGDWQTALARLSQTKGDVFLPVADNILTICETPCFENDLAEKIFEWIAFVYGKDTLEENLQFIADVLGGKGEARDVIRRYLLHGFYSDHLKLYQNRPLYWLFRSGKQQGFQALMYIHRYRSDLLAHLHSAYVCPQIAHLHTNLATLESAIKTTPCDNATIQKDIAKRKAQLSELQLFEKTLCRLAEQRIELNPDDGIKMNYARLADVLKKL